MLIDSMKDIKETLRHKNVDRNPQATEISHLRCEVIVGDGTQER